MIKKNITSLLLFSFLQSFAQEKAETYHLLLPAKDGNMTQLIQTGYNGAKKLMAISSCERCPPGAYMYEEKASELLGKDIYAVLGLYVIAYDEDSYYTVYPSDMIPLEKGEWSTFSYYNFYSKDKSKLSKITKEEIENLAIALSKEALNK